MITPLPGPGMVEENTREPKLPEPKLELRDGTQCSSPYLTVTLTQYMHSPGLLLSQKNTVLTENMVGPHTHFSSASSGREA